jgi:starch-binding outer membrane protein, SusD/RagB family
MKHIIKYSAYSLLGAGLLLSSCKKNLELTPPYSSTTGNAFNNLDDYNGQLNGAYTNFASPNYYNGFLGCTSEVPTDNVYETIESLVNYQEIANWEYLGNEGYMASVWLTPYTTIRQANVIITGIDQFKSENETKYNRILGQALAARAIAHFDLLKSFSNNLDRNSTDPGVPVKTTTDNGFPARNSVKEVYDAIYADLTKAITLLLNVDRSVNASGNRGNIDVWGTRAALAKVALYAKDYPTAIANATLCINQFPLSSRASFAGIWNDANANEVIWSVQNNAGDPGSPIPSADVMSFRANRNTFGAHVSLLNLYDRANDIRFSTYFFVRNTTGAISNYAFQKFKGKGSAADNVVNFKVFRVAEMYLIRAEANANTSGQDAAASADLNALKTARITGWANVSYTGTALKDEIANERRRELCLEGHRWFDLKRTNRTVARPFAGLGNPNAQMGTSLPSSSIKWVWPIPEDELLANSAMTQNPGY